MDWLRQFLQRIQAFFRSAQLDRELEAEMLAHVQFATEENLEHGMSLSEARRRALIQFGGPQQAKEQHREARSLPFLESLLQDLRFGFRMLRKSPGFTAVAVLTLALGIGANTAIFSVVNGVLLNPLPYPHSEQLITLHESKPNFATGSISYPNFLDWQKNNRTFSSMAIQRGNSSLILTGLGEAEQANVVFVSSDYFRQLGVVPALGRDFAPGEDRVGAAPLVMITEGFWKRKFGSSPEVLTKSLTLDGKDFSIIGVVPAKFDLLGALRSRDVYIPIGQWNNPLLLNRAAGLGIHGIGRLKPGVTLEQARADMERVTRDLAGVYPESDKGIGAALIPLRERMLGRAERFLLLLFGAVGFVLLIACVNVANLVLARSANREREFAVRKALGAGQSHLVRQLVTEGILLALIGGGVGLLFATWGVRAALSRLPANLPRAGEVGIDTHVLLFSAVASVLTGILFSLVPAIKSSRANLHDALKEGGRGTSGVRHRAQSVLVATEMALAVVLLVGAGLMIRTLAALWNVNPGFNPRNVLTFGLSLPQSLKQANAETVRASFREVHSKFSIVPGVQKLSFSWGAVPLSSDDEWLFWIDGQPKPASENDMNWALDYVVQPDYLEVMGIPLVSGRFFNERDDEHASPVAVIDEVLAQKFFSGQNPVGQRLHLNSTGQTAEIVGVVGHVKQWGLDSDDKQELRAELYTPFMQLANSQMSQAASGVGVVVRTQGQAPVFESIRRASRELSDQQVVSNVQTMDEIIDGSLADRQFTLILLATFAALALVLASIGIYGVVSYVVSQRTQEIGVRMAMGARPWDVLRLIVGQGAKMATAGVGIGLLSAFALTRFMAGMVYGISTTDPVTFLAVAAVLIFMALAACYLPARRATRVDPVVALRYE
ncbi:MAG TPA: ABC transporter permease [Methylomirabilota bacterium]|nr:ABC transporter permease [Methylomirabilota bacterium]